MKERRTFAELAEDWKQGQRQAFVNGWHRLPAIFGALLGASCVGAAFESHTVFDALMYAVGGILLFAAGLWVSRLLYKDFHRRLKKLGLE